MKPAIQSVAEQVYNRLLDEIVKGARPAGDKLSEEHVCASLGVSRTPAREALMRLHRDGLVERFPRRGCFVKSQDAAEIAELFECRAWLECLALEQGFDDIPDEALGGLERALKPGAALTRAASLKADDRLHALIIEACPNRHLREVAGQMLLRTYPFRFWRTHSGAPVGAVSRERLAIVRAIRRGDRAAASRLLREHILRGREMILKNAARRAAAGGDGA